MALVVQLDFRGPIGNRGREVNVENEKIIEMVGDFYRTLYDSLVFENIRLMSRFNSSTTGEDNDGDRKTREELAKELAHCAIVTIASQYEVTDENDGMRQVAVSGDEMKQHLDGAIDLIAGWLGPLEGGLAFEGSKYGAPERYFYK